jgi:ABC-type multidrug transport system permease subunit
MKVPYKRESLRIAEDNGYSVYSKFIDSVKDYFLWAKYVGLPKKKYTATSYAAELKQEGYYTDTVDNYAEGITYWYKKQSMELIISSFSIITIVAMVVFLVYYLVKKLKK